ncbi:MAG: sigma-70 family RNA polymerase sigma factor [Bacteroidota bacterium]
MPAKEYTEEEIIKGCVRNDRFFQEVLYRKYFAKMMHLCFRYTSDRDKAMEIVNNGFLRVFQKIDKYSFKGSFEGWVRKLVFHSISDYFRKESKYAETIIFESYEKVDNHSILNQMYVEDIMRLVRSLPPATQKVFELYAIEGYTHVEIGKELGISSGTSKWHLAEARKKLKIMLKTLQTSYYHE